MLAQSTRSRYTRNIWPEPLMGYPWGWHVTEKTGIISASEKHISYIVVINFHWFFVLMDYWVGVLEFILALVFFARCVSWWHLLVLPFFVCPTDADWIFWGSRCCHLRLLYGPVEKGQACHSLSTITKNPLRGFRLIVLVLSSVFQECFHYLGIFGKFQYGFWFPVNCVYNRLIL